MRFMVTVLFHTCSEPNKEIMFVDEVISCWTIVIDESEKVLHRTLQNRIGRRIRAYKKLRSRSHSWGIVPFSVSIVKLQPFAARASFFVNITSLGIVSIQRYFPILANCPLRFQFCIVIFHFDFCILNLQRPLGLFVLRLLSRGAMALDAEHRRTNAEFRRRDCTLPHSSAYVPRMFRI